jgi:hypothetical protein
MTYPSKFWPLDFEPEDQIYESPSWDLPGLRRTRKPPRAKNSVNGKGQRQRR